MRRQPKTGYLALLALTGVMVILPDPAVIAAPSTPPPEIERWAGATRYETSASVSIHGYPGGSSVVFVANGEEFPDALAAAPVAAALGGPVLITQPDELPAAVLRETQRLAPDRVYVIGGTAAVSADVEESQATVAPVERLAGTDRYETAAAVSRVAYPGRAPVVFVASGANFPDALAGAAAAGHLDGPLLLTTPTALSPAAEAALRQLRPLRTVVLGGAAAISDSVVERLRAIGGSPVDRWSGDDRVATSTFVSSQAFPEGGDVVFVASGQRFPDALSGAAVAGAVDGPLLLAAPDGPGEQLLTEMRRLQSSRVVLLGGTAVLSDRFREDLERGLR